jgi:hypothetical protein
MKKLLFLFVVILFSSCEDRMEKCIKNVMESENVSRSVAKEMCQESKEAGQAR